MTEIIEWLDGKKTYLIAVGIGIVTALHSLGIIDDATAAVVLGILGAGGVSSIRAAITKSS